MKFNFSRLIFIFLFINNLIMANDGTLDSSFGTGGEVTTSFTGFFSSFASCVIQQTDGKLVAAGTSSSFTGSNFAIARYQTDGSPDNSFGTNGQVTLAFGSPLNPVNSAISIIQQSSGKLIVAGTTSTFVPAVSSFAITRLNTDGTQDLTFGTGGQTLTTFSGNTGNHANGMASLPGDGFVVVGETSIPSNSRFAVASYNSNGILQNQTTIQLTSDSGEQSVPYGVAVQQDGKIVVVGYLLPSVVTPTCVRQFAIVRLNPDLTLDTTFGSNGVVTFCFNSSANDGQAKSVAIQQNGKIIVAGWNTNGSGNTQFAVAGLDTNGNLDTNFNGSGQILFDFGGTDDEANSVTVNQGKIVVGGFTNVMGGNQFALARLTLAGDLDPTFGTNGKVITPFGSGSTINSVIIQTDLKIVAAGFSVSTFGLARYLVNFVAITSPTDGEVLHNPQPLFSGNMETGNTIVTVSIDGGVPQSATTIDSSAGTWSFLPSGFLSQGAHFVEAFTTDPSGNSVRSAIISFTIELAPVCIFPADALTIAIRNKYSGRSGLGLFHI